MAGSADGRVERTTACFDGAGGRGEAKSAVPVALDGEAGAVPETGFVSVGGSGAEEVGEVGGGFGDGSVGVVVDDGVDAADLAGEFGALGCLAVVGGEAFARPPGLYRCGTGALFEVGDPSAAGLDEVGVTAALPGAAERLMPCVRALHLVGELSGYGGRLLDVLDQDATYLRAGGAVSLERGSEVGSFGR